MAKGKVVEEGKVAAVETRYDVVIYEIASSKVYSVIGTNMSRNAGFHNAERRRETVISSIDDGYGVRIVPAGRFAKGDVLPD